MSGYYLKGNIIGDFFMVGTDLENTSYIFSNTGTNETFGFYHISNFGQNTMNPLFFNFENGLLKTSSYYVFQGQNGITSSVTVPVQKLSIKPVDTNVSGMQAGVFYNIIGSGEVNFPIIVNADKNYIIKNVRFVPRNYYPVDKCEIANTLSSELNWINNPLTYKQRGFTTKTECDNKIFYTYCLLNEYCGTKNCNGVCKDGGSCVQTDGVYSCGKSQGKTTIFLMPIIVFLVVFLLVIFLIFLVTRNETIYTFSDY